ARQLAQRAPVVGGSGEEVQRSARGGHSLTTSALPSLTGAALPPLTLQTLQLRGAQKWPPHSPTRRTTVPARPPHSPTRRTTVPARPPHSPTRRTTQIAASPFSPVRMRIASP